MTATNLETPVSVAPVAGTGLDGVAANPQGEGGKAATPILEIRVVGTPAPQGSKRGFVVAGRVNVVDDNKPRLRDWRSDVKNAALAVIGAREGTGDPFALLTGPVDLDITFFMPRPKGHYRTGRNAHLLRDTAPARPTTKPDVDKLLRAVLDAIKGAVYLDDSQVVTLTGRKHYATRQPGARIRVNVMGDKVSDNLKHTDGREIDGRATPAAGA